MKQKTENCLRAWPRVQEKLSDICSEARCPRALLENFKTHKNFKLNN